MTSVEKAVELITAQQTEQYALGPVWCVGEQLKDMLQNDEDAAALVVKDLEQDSMGIAECEKKIHDFARDNGGFCGPKDADRIIRKFYGIENTHPPPRPGGICRAAEENQRDGFSVKECPT